MSAPSVFINCPFDTDYKPLLGALVFTAFVCGMRPRSALEDDGRGVMRFERLCKLVEQSPFGIHDLSRTETNDDGMPRFNMPFELGLYLGAQRYGGPKQKRKQTLVLVRSKHTLGRYLSDLAGVDPVAHEGEILKIIRAARNFFVRALTAEAELNDTPPPRLPGPSAIVASYSDFVKRLPSIARDNGFDLAEIDPIESYVDYCHVVVDYLKEKAGAA